MRTFNRLVEGWDIASGEHCSHRPNPLLISSMNLELVPDPNYQLFFVLLSVDTGITFLISTVDDKNKSSA